MKWFIKFDHDLHENAVERYPFLRVIDYDHKPSDLKLRYKFLKLASRWDCGTCQSRQFHVVC
jgi:hypothetical protein